MIPIDEQGKGGCMQMNKSEQSTINNPSVNPNRDQQIRNQSKLVNKCLRSNPIGDNQVQRSIIQVMALMETKVDHHISKPDQPRR